MKGFGFSVFFLRSGRRLLPVFFLPGDVPQDVIFLSPVLERRWSSVPWVYCFLLLCEVLEIGQSVAPFLFLSLVM